MGEAHVLILHEPNKAESVPLDIDLLALCHFRRPLVAVGAPAHNGTGNESAISGQNLTAWTQQREPNLSEA